MGRNPWEDMDPDVLAMRGGGGSGMSWGKIFIGLIVIGVLTFFAAYYIPLFRAHDTLTAEHRRISDRAQALDQKLGQTNTALQAAQAKLRTLEAEQSQRESGTLQATARTDSVRAALGTAFERYSRKGSLAVGAEGDRVIVALADALVFAPRKLDVSNQGRSILCEFAKASGGRAIEVRAFDSGEPPAAPLATKYPTAWSLRNARAAGIAEVLTEKCGVQASKLLAAGAGSVQSASTLGAKLPAERVELSLLVDGRTP